MAQAPTLYDVQLELSDSDRGVQCERRLKVARHPSETMERLWLRLLAFCWRYDERLTFTADISDADAPDLRSDDFTGRTTQWIRVGRPDPAKIRRAVTQTPGAEVSVFFDSPARLEAFRRQAEEEKVTHLEKVNLTCVSQELLRALAARDERRIKLTATIAGDHLYLDLEGEALDSELTSRRLGPP